LLALACAKRAEAIGADAGDIPAFNLAFRPFAGAGDAVRLDGTGAGAAGTLLLNKLNGLSGKGVRLEAAGAAGAAATGAAGAAGAAATGAAGAADAAEAAGLPTLLLN